ncbi:bifunctional 2-keto-4-hydroxyglutarate aldolase/2-keto-3-deoxy-6-phosphogluconate aldolase [Gracilibacillus sp. YIM 98692]|uniref:bifunctional 2-keto-4-hydroxyglutarate aldolase/2-keto-3-deoxy-6-phosphogluconate aldolase n=1 Tax=Gracilibacillus sp. YIM 98692 TaxID=2663532 RepID=UPI0013D212D6|nr:bifunctional 2-keto-4-hydroxyglutarate aldolase/2-keto-3-deoxy-6-phosphogluconate aldolase [Gracilibacillus sp. YIM 98692]
MLDKETIIKNITDVGIVAVVRADNTDQALRIAEACLEGGINALEITFTVPGAHRVIEKLSDSYNEGEIVLGAGTVMDSETARIAILSGAQYIVSPYFDEETVRLSNRYRVPCMPGAMTIKEVVEAMEAGVDIIKLFPGEVNGPQMIKAIKGPVPQAKLMPTGGVDINNVHEWIKAGASAVGAGGSLVGSAKQGDYKEITRRAKQFVEVIKETRTDMS